MSPLKIFVKISGYFLKISPFLKPFRSSGKICKNVSTIYRKIPAQPFSTSPESPQIYVKYFKKYSFDATKIIVYYFFRSCFHL